MIAMEYGLQRLRNIGVEYWRNAIGADGTQNLYDVRQKISGQAWLSNRSVFVLNRKYVEVSSGIWPGHAEGIAAKVGMSFFFVLGLGVWYTTGIHPVLFGHFLFREKILDDPQIAFWLSSIIFLPPIWAMWKFILHPMYRGGAYTWLLNQIRGRIRFNRETRKVYVLRPKSCGGNVILDWDRVQVNLRMPNYDFRNRKPMAFDSISRSPMALYHPPRDDGSGEEIVPFGSEFDDLDVSKAYWEYIRRFMEGPERKPQELADEAAVMHEAFTYVGMPSREQYRLESGGCGPFVLTLQMLSQATCYWPTFPKEWQSDSGLGEPEDDPISTGALMNFDALKAKGKLTEAQWKHAQEIGWIKKSEAFKTK